MTLHELLAEIGRAGIAASQACRDGVRQRLDSMFEPPDKDGERVPKTVPLNISGRHVDVPLVSLSPASTLDMESLCVEFEAEVSLPATDKPDKPKKTDDGDGAPNARSYGGTLPAMRLTADKPDDQIPEAVLSLDMKRGLIKRSTRFKVTASFKMGPSAEVVEAVRDQMAEQVRQQLRG